MPPTPTLQDVLPILGRPMLVRHQGKVCLASMIRHSDGLLEYETRLSPDFPTTEAAQDFYLTLVRAMLDGERIWPVIERLCARSCPPPVSPDSLPPPPS